MKFELEKKPLPLKMGQEKPSLQFFSSLVEINKFNFPSIYLSQGNVKDLLLLLHLHFKKINPSIYRQ
jgi:hypothetical protein